ncbi:hypothetical protein GCM10009548_55510 [Streptomyces malaysiensis subsp. malaysiensis]
MPPVSPTMAIRMTAKARPGLPCDPEDLRPFFGAATFSYLPVQPPRIGGARGGHEVLWGRAPAGA